MIGPQSLIQPRLLTTYLQCFSVTHHLVDLEAKQISDPWAMELWNQTHVLPIRRHMCPRSVLGSLAGAWGTIEKGLGYPDATG
jgi:hypothetical protein